MLDALKKHRKTILLTTVVLILALFGFSQYTRARSLEYRRVNEYNRIFSELTEYVDDLEITLLKGQVVSTSDRMVKLSTDLYGQASAAKANLSLLPIEGEQMEKTSEFLSQVGEYALSLSDKMLRGEELSSEEIKTMQELSVYAGKLRTGLDALLLEIMEGKRSYSEKRADASLLSENGETSISNQLLVLEEEFHDYPSLIYDGPFSQHLELKESPLLKGKKEITEDMAKKYAVKFTGEKDVTVTEINGKLPSYIVKGNNTTAEFTKSGGFLLMLLKDRIADEEKLSEEDVRKKAELFLRDNGFNNMRESYFEKRDGSIVINYACCQDDYIVYPDLVKIKIALDDGEVIGFESRGYVMNHTSREISEPRITKEQALKNINKNLEIDGVSMAIIPLENGSEACCWQIKGKVSDKHFLMFVNTQTGYTEDVQILLESESGTLAV